MIQEIHLESSTACDARCVFCPHDSLQRSGRMSWGTFKKIVDEAVDMGITRFTPFRLGEPLLFPGLIQWIEYIGSKGGKVTIFTNANNLTDSIGDDLLANSAAISSLHISFHGGTKQVYEAFMGLQFEKVIANVNSFVDKKPMFPVYIFSTIHPDTVDSLDEFNNLWDPTKFEGIDIRDSMEWAGEKPNAMSLITFLHTRNDVKRVPCERILYQLDVMYDGRVCLCCVDAHGSIIFGNLIDNSLREVLRNPERRRYIEAHLAGKWDSLPLCNECGINIRAI